MSRSLAKRALQRAGLLLLVAAAGAACKGEADGSSYEGYPAEGASAQMKLVSPGAEPLRPMRWRPQSLQPVAAPPAGCVGFLSTA